MILYTTKIAVKMAYIFSQRYPECLFTRYSNSRRDHVVLVNEFDFSAFITFKFNNNISYSHSNNDFMHTIYDIITNVRPARI